MKTRSNVRIYRRSWSRRIFIKYVFARFIHTQTPSPYHGQGDVVTSKPIQHNDSRGNSVSRELNTQSQVKNITVLSSILMDGVCVIGLCIYALAMQEYCSSVYGCYFGCMFRNMTQSCGIRFNENINIRLSLFAYKTTVNPSC